MTRVPPPLRWLLALVALLGVAWALIVPAWQAPDENAHFAYVQSLAERGDLPGDEIGRTFSSEQRLATDESNAAQTAATPQTDPNWSEDAFQRWRRNDADATRNDGGGENPAAVNPPLYYLYAVPFYELASSGDVFSRLLAVRLGTLLLLLGTVAAAWAAAGEAFGRRRLLQLSVASIVGLLPMMTFLSAAVSPDSLLFLLWTTTVWLALRALRRGLDPRLALALGGVVGLAVVTKATSYALLPALAFVLALGARRLWRAGQPQRAITAAATGGVAFLLPAAAWFLTARALDRPVASQVRGLASESEVNLSEFASYLWQYYLPRPGFLSEFTDFETLDGLPAWVVWVKRAFGSFGWLEVQFPDSVYAFILALVVVSLVAGGVSLWSRPQRWTGAALGLLFVLPLLAALHWTEYRLSLGAGGLFNQGRYILPVVVLLALAAGHALTLLAPLRRQLAVAALLGGVLAFQLASLAIVTARFYAA